MGGETNVSFYWCDSEYRHMLDIARQKKKKKKKNAYKSENSQLSKWSALEYLALPQFYLMIWLKDCKQKSISVWTSLFLLRRRFADLASSDRTNRGL